jgi:hypothetical protein
VSADWHIKAYDGTYLEVPGAMYVDDLGINVYSLKFGTGEKAVIRQRTSRQRYAVVKNDKFFRDLYIYCGKYELNQCSYYGEPTPYVGPVGGYAQYDTPVRREGRIGENHVDFWVIEPGSGGNLSTQGDPDRPEARFDFELINRKYV